MSTMIRCACPAFLFLLAACGGTPKPAPEAPSAPEPAETAGPVQKKVEKSEGESPAAASSAQTPAKEQPKARSGRPAPIYQGAAEPQTVGQDGAVFRTDDGGEVRLPFGWITDSRNVLFNQDKKGKATAGRVGNLYVIHIQMPEAQFRVGEELPSETIETRSDPFVIKLPLPAGSNSANLAIETIAPDPKTKRNKSTWTIVAMTKMETADTGNRAVFEMNTLPDGHIHLTTSAPNAPSAAPAAQ